MGMSLVTCISKDASFSFRALFSALNKNSLRSSTFRQIDSAQILVLNPELTLTKAPCSVCAESCQAHAGHLGNINKIILEADAHLLDYATIFEIPQSTLNMVAQEIVHFRQS